MASWEAWAVRLKDGCWAGKPGSGYVESIKYAQLYPSKKRALNRLRDLTWRGERVVQVSLSCCDEP